MDLRFSSLSATGAATGISLTNTGGAFDADAGTLNNGAHTSADVALNGGTTNFTYDGTINDDQGQLVSIANQTGGTKDFNGNVTDGNDNDGGGISLSSNTGATIRFDGGLTLDTGATNAFSATGGGTIAVTDPAGATDNIIETTTGTALNVTSTNIHSDGLTFKKVDSNGAATGILLNTTGNAGGLNVTGFDNGNGCTAANFSGCTGGTILNSSTAGMALANSVVTSNGNAVGEHGLDYDNVRGTSSISSSAVNGSGEFNARVDNDNGTLGLTVNNSTFSNNSSSVGADGLLLYGDGTATMKSLVQNSTFNGNRDDGFQILANADSNVDVTFAGNTVNAAGNPGAVSAHAAVTLTSNTTSDVKVAASNNTIKGADGSALIINPIGSTSTFDATIDSNTIGTSGVAGSGSATGQGIRAIPAQNVDAEILIKNNQIHGTGQQAMLLRHNDGSGDSDFTVHNNLIRHVGSGNEPIFVQSGSLNTDTTDVCADIGGPNSPPPLRENDFAGQASGGVTDIAFRRPSAAAGAHLKLPGFDGNPSNLATYIQNRNVGTPSVINFSGALEAGPSACQQPSAPAAP
jgi:hypothetical protein